VNILKNAYIFAVIKRIYLKKTYLPIIPAIYALFHLLKNRGLNSATKIIILGILTSFVLTTASLGSYISPVRYFQLISIFIFADYLYTHGKTHEMLLSIKALIIIASIFVILETFTPISLYSNKTFYLFKRVSGITGEPNFSSALLFSVGIFLLYFKNLKWSVLAIILGSFGFSRGFILALLIGLIFLLVKKINKNVLERLSRVVFFIFLSYPLLLEISHQYLPKKVFQKIHDLNPRLKHQLFFINAVKNNPLGIGLGNAKEYYKNNYKIIFKKGPGEKRNEQHNLPTQILSELGIPFYLAFIIISLFYFFRLKNSWPITLVLLPYFFLNGLNEILLYIFIPIIIKYETKENKNFADIFKSRPKWWPQAS